jgi:hypothetical protein
MPYNTGSVPEMMRERKGMNKIEKLDSSVFTKSRWESGTIHEIIENPCRYQYITVVFGRNALRKYTIGYCDAKSLLVRPKTGEVAVMCFKDGRHFWFHLRKNEFDRIWPKVLQ